MKRFVVFVSMPMRGLTDAERDAKFAENSKKAVEAAKEYLKEEGVTELPEIIVADSIFHDEVPEFIQSSSLYCLGYSFQVLSGCDFVYFAEGWENARGCSLEYQAAMEYGITICEDYRVNVENTKEKP